MRHNNTKDSVDKLRIAYDLLKDIIRNPTKMGYIGIISKIKPESKEVINLRLLKYRDEVDVILDDITMKILKKIGFDKLPESIKK